MAGDRLELIEVVRATPTRRVSKSYDRDLRRVVSVTSDSLQGRDADALLAQLRPFTALPPTKALAPMLDAYVEDDRIVVVSPWIEGVDLLALLVASGTPGLPVTAVLTWLDQVGEAVRYLQAHGLNHGNIRPANLVLNSEQRIIVVGLGSGVLEPPPVGMVHPDVRGLAATAAALLTGSSPTVGAISGTDAVSGAALQRALLPALDNHGDRDVAVEHLLSTLRHELNAALPTGVVTFLLTDIVGSTRRWEADATSMAAQLGRHDHLMAETVEAAGGRLLKARGEGDATFSVFTRASAAVIAALAAQQRLRDETELVVRMAIHTGEAELRDADYFGRTVNRAARLRSIAPDGGIALSRATADLVIDALPAGASLVDRGEISLKDLDRPERVFDVTSEVLTGVVPVASVAPSTTLRAPSTSSDLPPSAPSSTPVSDVAPLGTPAPTMVVTPLPSMGTAGRPSTDGKGRARRLLIVAGSAVLVAVVAVVLITSRGGVNKASSTNTTTERPATGAPPVRLDNALLQAGDLPPALTQRSALSFDSKDESCGQPSVDVRVAPVDTAAFSAQDPAASVTVAEYLRRYIDEATARRAVALIIDGFACPTVSATDTEGKTASGTVGDTVQLAGLGTAVSYRTLDFGTVKVGLAIAQRGRFTMVLQYASSHTAGAELQAQVAKLTGAALQRVDA